MGERRERVSSRRHDYTKKCWRIFSYPVCYRQIGSESFKTARNKAFEDFSNVYIRKLRDLAAQAMARRQKTGKTSGQSTVRLGLPMIAFWRQQVRKFKVTSIELAMSDYITAHEKLAVAKLQTEQLAKELAEREKSLREREAALPEKEGENVYLRSHCRRLERAIQVLEKQNQLLQETITKGSLWVSHHVRNAPIEEGAPLDEFDEAIEMMRPQSDPRAI